jgi:hypothetical protein
MMAKETGFANFTPKQSKEFIKAQNKQPQDPFAGEQRRKNKQQSMNRKG